MVDRFSTFDKSTRNESIYLFDVSAECRTGRRARRRSQTAAARRRVVEDAPPSTPAEHPAGCCPPELRGAARRHARPVGRERSVQVVVSQPTIRPHGGLGQGAPDRPPRGRPGAAPAACPPPRPTMGGAAPTTGLVAAHATARRESAPPPARRRRTRRQLDEDRAALPPSPPVSSRNRSSGRRAAREAELVRDRLRQLDGEPERGRCRGRPLRVDRRFVRM